LTASIFNVTLFPTTALDVTFAKTNCIALGPAGAGLMVNNMLPEVPPPGAGFTTVTLDVPAVATSAAVINAVTVDDDTKVVAVSEPFHCTVEFPTKLDPLRVRVKLDTPAIVEVGESEVRVGAGLSAVVTVNV
jgi:hypothetical protein